MFQFTQPKRAATSLTVHLNQHTKVSIHAAQAGCDQRAKKVLTLSICFNSRSPSGLRQRDGLLQPHRVGVSIHAAQAGCDPMGKTQQQWSISFNSRSPSGLRHSLSVLMTLSFRFQFTQPKRAATDGLNASTVIVDVSIHAAQAGCDLPWRRS